MMQTRLIVLVLLKSNLHTHNNAMKNLVIGCSSFSNPQHKAWNHLKNNLEVQFLEYGNLSGIVREDLYCDGLVYIQFLDDALVDDTSESDSENLDTYLNQVLSLIEERCRSSARIFIFGFSCWTPINVVRNAKIISERKKINIKFLNMLEKTASKYSNFYFIDLDACFSEFGLTKCFDTRNWYFARTRMSSLGNEVIANSISLILKRHEKAAHKLLILDCDNTLWGGVIGEDGLSGLELGSDGVGDVFVDFQKALVQLKTEGVLLALASKNNEDDVWNVFHNHESMILSRSDIVAAKINWDEKSKNISDLAQELDLDVSSFVFWDDNPIEREKTKLLLPSMYTVDVPSEVWEWPSSIKTLFELSKFYITDDDKEKSSQYSARHEFISSRKQSLDVNSFLKSIKLSATIVPFGEGNSFRAVQLCQKTNQFNLTTRRHTAESLQKIALTDSQYCSLASLKDKFGNHGLVGLFCLQDINGSDLYIDTFLLSCRVLGRHLESWMMSQIIDIARNNNFTRLIAEFIPSKRNTVAERFLEDCGFTRFNSTTADDEELFAGVNINGISYFRSLGKLSNLPENLYES